MQIEITDRETALALVAHMQRRAQAQGTELRPPPEEPTTCCGRGCNGCVWEGHYTAVQWWLEEAEAVLDAG